MKKEKKKGTARNTRLLQPTSSYLCSSCPKSSPVPVFRASQLAGCGEGGLQVDPEQSPALLPKSSRHFVVLHGQTQVLAGI